MNNNIKTVDEKWEDELWERRSIEHNNSKEILKTKILTHQAWEVLAFLKRYAAILLFESNRFFNELNKNSRSLSQQITEIDKIIKAKSTSLNTTGLDYRIIAEHLVKLPAEAKKISWKGILEFAWDRAHTPQDFLETFTIITNIDYNNCKEIYESKKKFVTNGQWALDPKVDHIHFVEINQIDNTIYENDWTFPSTDGNLRFSPKRNHTPIFRAPTQTEIDDIQVPHQYRFKSLRPYIDRIDKARFEEAERLEKARAESARTTNHQYPSLEDLFSSSDDSSDDLVDTLSRKSNNNQPAGSNNEPPDLMSRQNYEREPSQPTQILTDNHAAAHAVQKTNATITPVKEEERESDEDSMTFGSLAGRSPRIPDTITLAPRNNTESTTSSVTSANLNSNSLRRGAINNTEYESDTSNLSYRWSGDRITYGYGPREGWTISVNESTYNYPGEDLPDTEECKRIEENELNRLYEADDEDQDDETINV